MLSTAKVRREACSPHAIDHIVQRSRLATSFVSNVNLPLSQLNFDSWKDWSERLVAYDPVDKPLLGNK